MYVMDTTRLMLMVQMLGKLSGMNGNWLMVKLLNSQNTVLTKSQAMMHISMVQRLLKLMLPKLLKQMAHHKMVKTSQKAK